MFDKVRVSSGTLAIMLFTASPGLIRAASVRAWEGKIDLPTYVLGEEDPAPPFPLDNQHRVYPYTMLDDLTDHVETRTYRAIYLENEFIKMIVLPDLGGRVFSVYDKRDRREVFLRNNVVKYALVALRGAWIPGGIEFNFPDGHNMVTVSPVSSTFRQNPGGSATVIVGDVDQITGMHWEVALTLQPGQARVEQHVTLFNCTPTTNLYWYWANAAVPATDDTQFIYPMREFYTDVRGVVWSYPVHAGVDYSWSRNIRQPISIFARQVHRNFFGVYFHKSDYGIVHVADFREVPGKKIWAWGAADDGLIWKEMINDQNEIQSGRYETQLDYEFMPPQRAESWTEYWYPVHGLGGGFVEATSQLAMNVHYLPPRGSEKAQVKFVICATVEIPDAKVSVKLGSRLLRQYELKPLHPLTATELTMPVGNLESAKQNLGVVVEAADGRTLLSWSAAGPIDGNIDFVPLADKSPREELSPEEMSVEQLFLSGVEQER